MNKEILAHRGLLRQKQTNIIIKIYCLSICNSNKLVFFTSRDQVPRHRDIIKCPGLYVYLNGVPGYAPIRVGDIFAPLLILGREWVWWEWKLYTSAVG